MKELLLLPQRYIFSSKSQPKNGTYASDSGYCCYHKGTYFQANHNNISRFIIALNVVVATTKVHIFKQITTDNEVGRKFVSLLLLPQRYIFSSKSQHRKDLRTFFNRCCCYHKGTYFQANHNCGLRLAIVMSLLLLPQRYIFSSKSQQIIDTIYSNGCCCCYHKGTYFQANHNNSNVGVDSLPVVVATTKVHIFKQITTKTILLWQKKKLLLLPQRYIFSSKSQRLIYCGGTTVSCCCYHKGTYFQANHN